VYRRYGGPEVVQWEEWPRPNPGRGEVLVRVQAAALNPKDVLLRKGKFAALSGRRFPKQLGHDLVGRVEALGRGAPASLQGARVFGFYGGFRALRGSIADYAVIRADHVAPVAERVDAAHAAAAPLAGSTALQALRDDGQLAPGERVLIVGASGGVGTFAVQIAKLLGAHVSASASARNRELLRGLGADDVLDYASERPFGDGNFDLVLDCFGTLRADHVRPLLRAEGRFVSLVPSPGIVRDVAWGAVVSPRTRLTVVKPRTRDLAQLADWLEQKRLRSVVEMVYAPSELHEAMRHLETRHARGKLVIRMEDVVLA
jgi:NADPH:quinone reductase-like Zn-dependent oxidoreductase